MHRSGAQGHQASAAGQRHACMFTPLPWQLPSAQPTCDVDGLGKGAEPRSAHPDKALGMGG